MLKKSYFTIIVTTILVFLSYIYLKPLTPTSVLTSENYSLNTKGMKYKRPPIFRPMSKYRDNGKFFIHPGGEKVAKGIFTFRKELLLKFSFSIQEGSPSGDIKFIINKNGTNLKSLFINTKHSESIKIRVKKGDYIEVIADKNGGTAGDWGNLEIFIIDELYTFKNFLIPFIWSLLIIYLYGKGYLYTSLNSYLVFLLIIFAEKINFGVMRYEVIVTYTLLMFALTFLFVLIYQELVFLKRFRAAFTVSVVIMFFVYVIPLLFAIYALIFHHEVTSDIMFAIFQTNKDESLEFISVSIPIKYILLFIFFTLVVGFLLYKQEKKETESVEKSLLLFITILLFSIFSINYQHLRIPMFIYDNYTTYQKELERFANLQKRRKAGKIKFSASKKESGEVYVVVIGESLNKQHMSVYGYLRETTPNLNRLYENNDTIFFQKAYSNYLQTMQSLSFALTEANQYNNKKYFDSLSILNIFNKANFDTYWVTNQVFLGAWDNIVAAIGHDAIHKIPLNHIHGAGAVTNFDGSAIPVLKAILDKKTSKNKVIFIHLIGSHVKYEYRFPHDKFNKFSGTISPLEFGKFSNSKYLNNYDNSVYYNDYVVTSLLKTLQDSKGVRAFLYFSDHGEDVVRHLKHDSNEPKPNMSQIPMIAWFSKEYKDRYPNKYKILYSRKDRLFSNDLIFNTLIGLTNVKTNRYNSKYDFTSKDYAINAKNALIHHGAAYYTDKDNYIYWRDVNSKYLKKIDIIHKFAPNNIEVLANLSEILYDGYSSFKLNLYYNPKRNSLNIGTSSKYINYTFSDYLKSISLNKIDNIIVNIDGLQEHYTKIIKILNRQNIKDKVIIVSKNLEISKVFANDGWRVAFDLNSDKIISIIRGGDRLKIEGLIEQINKSNVSFLLLKDSLYKSIKSFESKIDGGIKFIIILEKLKIANNNFKTVVSKEEIFRDNRVYMFVIEYPSLFEL